MAVSGVRERVSTIQFISKFFRLFNQTMLFCCLVSAIVHCELPKHMKFTEEQVGSKQIVQPGSLEKHSINLGQHLEINPRGKRQFTRHDCPIAQMV